MKVKRKEQDIYTPLSWCDRMNSAYQMSIRNSVSAEAILDILTSPSTDSQQELQKRHLLFLETKRKSQCVPERSAKQ